MTKAKLIKRSDVAEHKKAKKTQNMQKSNVRKTMEVMAEWVGKQRNQCEDPRKAFAALFVQPQTQ